MLRLLATGVLAGIASTLSPLPAHATTTSTPSAAEKAIVDAGLLTIDDFPPGWRESPAPLARWRSVEHAEEETKQVHTVGAGRQELDTDDETVGLTASVTDLSPEYDAKRVLWRRGDLEINPVTE
jgi:hypothetical protein